MSKLPFTPCQWLLNLHIEKESWTKVLGLFLSPFKKRRFSGVLIISFTTYDSFKIFKWAGFAVCETGGPEFQVPSGCKSLFSLIRGFLGRAPVTFFFFFLL